LVKVLPKTSKNSNATKTGRLASTEVCGPTNENPQFATITTTNMVDLDLDFGISCKMLVAIQATSDTYNVTQCSIGNEIRNALSNDLLNGEPVKIADLKFNLLTNLTQYIDIDSNGNTTFKDGLGEGQYVFDYQICEASNPTNCSAAQITINVAGIASVSISSAACNADTTPIDLSKLLPEGISTTGTWIDTDNTGGLIGNILNPIDIPVNQYKYEYKIGGNCPRSIILTMNINDDCKVLPCKNIIIHNAVSSNEDGKNDYFEIENLENNDCYKNFKVEIFNRWGVLVFEKENYDNSGNAFRGKSEGRTTIDKNEGLPAGTYFYIVSYDSVDGVGTTLNIKKNGYLYLVR
jgi:gliding motility-associated-like protein